MPDFFCLPKEIVQEIISGKINHEDFQNNWPNKRDKENGFENQAKVNLFLEKNYNPVCSVLQENCRKEKCALFKKFDDTGGWICEEYKVDFPSADFDLRYHVGLIGTDKPDVELSLKNLRELKKYGGKYYCISCGNIYAKTREELQKNNEKILDPCSCEDFLFKTIDEFMDFLEKRELKKKLEKEAKDSEKRFRW